VEARYSNALEMAKIQHEAGIRGTYFFRFLPDHFDLGIIREIASLGHEIGYHYDDLSFCHGNYEDAYKRFEKNLATLREIAEVKTICMEGAPLSKWDNRDLWRKPQAASHKPQAASHKLQALSPKPQAHYSDFGIVGEPYFDIDFNKVFYLTDTGRRWDGAKVSVRDKVGSYRSAVSSQRSAVGSPEYEKWNTEHVTRNMNLKLHSSKDIISAAHLLPDQIMLTFHPQRWTDAPFPWVKELVMQNVKNMVKRMLLKGIK
jgi:hypothetical protein